MDRGLGPRVMRDTGSAPQSDEEMRIGRAVVKAPTDNLIKNLLDHGIIAQRASEAAPPGPTTASIIGEFLTSTRAIAPFARWSASAWAAASSSPSRLSACPWVRY